MENWTLKCTLLLQIFLWAPGTRQGQGIGLKKMAMIVTVVILGEFVNHNTDDDKNGNDECGKKDILPVALAHLGPDVRAKSPQGGRHPDHGSKDEESKLSHLLLSGQDKGFLRPLTAEVGH